jgi:hypothetical protein
MESTQDNNTNSEIPQILHNEGISNEEKQDMLSSIFAMARVWNAIKKSAQSVNEVKKEQERTRIGKENFLKVYAITMGTITVACEKADIDRTTFYDWIKKDPVFREAVAKIDSHRVDMVEDRLFKLIQQDDGPSIRFFLERRSGRYQPKGKVEVVTGKRTLEDLLDEYADQHGNEPTGESQTDAIERCAQGEAPQDTK